MNSTTLTDSVPTSIPTEGPTSAATTLNRDSNILTSTPTPTEAAMPIYPWIIIGIVIVIVIILILGTVVAVVMVVRKRKKGGAHFESRGGGGGMGGSGSRGGGPHPVRYRPANSQAQLLAQDRETAQTEQMQYEEIVDDEYVEVEQQPEKELYEYVETSKTDTLDYKESLEDYLTASGTVAERQGDARGQGDGGETKREGGGRGLGFGVGDVPKSPKMKPKPMNPRKDGKSYVNDMDAFAIELKKADLDSMQTPTTDANGRDTPSYVNNLNEFTSHLTQAMSASVQTTPPTTATQKSKPHYINDFNQFSEQLQEARASEEGQGACKGKKKSKRSYVNKMEDIDGLPSDEDEEGYTIFDPTRTQPDGAEVTGGGNEKEGDIYEDNPVERAPGSKGRGSDNRRHGSDENQKRVHEEASLQGKTSEQRPYVNDLLNIAQEAKILIAKEEATRRHHPYVNDVAKLVYEAKKQELQAAKDREEVKGQSDKEGVPGADKDKHNYVNDLACLMLRNS